MRCLVTGSGGFVGRHIAMALATAGHEVVGLAHRTWPGELEGRDRLSLARLDLSGPAPMPDGPFDAVVHCAAAIPSAVPDEAHLIRINAESTRRVFGHVLRAGATKVIFCSSMAVFGDIGPGTVDPDTPIRNPGAYGRSKLDGENRLAALCRAHEAIAGLSIRLPGVVGAGSHHNFLSDVMSRLLAGHPVVARNPDAAFNNVVHVDDLAGFAVDLLESLPTGHRVVTMAADEPLPIRRIVSILAASAGRAGGIRFETGGQPFLISPEPARRLGYRVPTVLDSVTRFADDAAAAHAKGRVQEA